MRARSACGAALLLALLGAACGEDGGGDIQEPETVASVLVDGPLRLVAGHAEQYTAVARNAVGGELTGRTFAWATTDPIVATVSPTGLVTALAAGQVELRATTEDVTGTLVVEVTAAPPVVATVGVTAPAGAVRVGEQLQLTAVARDAAGAEVNGRTFVWASADQAVATVNEAGLVTGVAAGPVEISATADGVTGSLAIEVVAAGTLVLGLEEVASGLDAPLYLASPPGDDRLFIVEQSGTIRLLKDGALLPAPFLDLSSKTVSKGEQGLLGLAFPADYASTGRFVVHYIDLSGDTQVSHYTVSADPDLADPGSESPVLSLDQPGAAHNGGQILFGPDGYLYIGLGDGGADDGVNGGRGQTLDDLFGAILRIGVQSGPGYTVPADNPFVGTAGARPEIWTYGLRNPWRFSLDRGTGDLYIADVGQKGWEEVNYSAAADGRGRGLNYGWSLMEGSDCLTPGCDPTGLALPTLAYDHGEGCSIIGGYVYRGPAIPLLRGAYLYSDYCRGWVRSFRVSGGTVVDENDWGSLEAGSRVLSMGEDAAGELYVLAADGRVLKVVAR